MQRGGRYKEPAPRPPTEPRASPGRPRERSSSSRRQPATPQLRDDYDNDDGDGARAGSSSAGKATATSFLDVRATVGDAFHLRAFPSHRPTRPLAPGRG